MEHMMTISFEMLDFSCAAIDVAKIVFDVISKKNR